MARGRSRFHAVKHSGGSGGRVHPHHPTPLTPEWLPEGAIAYADFVNERYFALGSQVELGILLGANAEFGNFNPANIIPGTGLVGAVNFAFALTDEVASPMLTNGFSFMAEMYLAVSGQPAGYVKINVANVPGFDDQHQVIFGNNGGVEPSILYVITTNEFDGGEVSVNPDPGIHRMAGTINGTHMAGCFDGGELFPLLATIPIPPTDIAVMLLSYTLRSIAFYNVIADEQLVTLTAF